MNFNIGDRVHHAVFGDGKIISFVKGYWPIMIKFDSGIEQNFSEEFLKHIEPKKK